MSLPLKDQFSDFEGTGVPMNRGSKMAARTPIQGLGGKEVEGQN
jgi:hypothetical protein